MPPPRRMRVQVPPSAPEPYGLLPQRRRKVFALARSPMRSSIPFARAASASTPCIMASAARLRAVVGPTGEFKASIEGRASSTRAVVAWGGAKAPHGAPLEFGWPSHNYAAQPAVYPAIGATTNSVIAEYNVAMGKLFARAFPNN